LVSFAALRKLKILPNRINPIIAIIIAFYFLSASIYYSEDLMQILAYSVLFLFISFILALAYISAKGEKKEKGKKV
jgi:membrane-bound acyltransferase YfiQ involved in biofilm formation